MLIDNTELKFQNNHTQDLIESFIDLTLKKYKSD